MLPMATNLTSRVLPGLATGVLNNLWNFGKDKILGQGLYQKTSQRGGSPYSLEWTWSIYHTQEPFNRKTERTDYCTSSIPRRSNAIWASIGVPLLLDASSEKSVQNRPVPRPSGYLWIIVLISLSISVWILLQYYL